MIALPSILLNHNSHHYGLYYEQKLDLRFALMLVKINTFVPGWSGQKVQ